MSDANAKENTTTPSSDVTPQPKAPPEASPDKTPPTAAAPLKPEAAKPKAEKPEVKSEAKPDTPKPAVAKAEAAAPAAVPVAPPATIEFALVVDDEPANRDFLMRLLEQAKLDVKGASTAQEARDMTAAADRLDIIVVDHKLPDGDGVDLMVELHAQYPAAYMVMATMLDERALMDKAFVNGCDVFLVKPHGFMELFRRIQTTKSTGEADALKRMIIDQYGPRPYRG